MALELERSPVGAKGKIALPRSFPQSGRRRIIGVLAAAVLVFGATAYLFIRSLGARAGPAFEFETARVDRGRIVAKVTATGTLSALVTVQVGSQVSGTIQELLVDFNAEVQKGDVLARIDSRLFQAALEQAQANAVAAQGNLAKARSLAEDADRQYERACNLAGDHIVAQADLDTARSNAEGARAQVQAAEGSVSQATAALHQAEVNLGYTTIVSPINGMVISRSVDRGQTVAASLQAPTLFLIAEDLRRMQVDTSVAESDVGKLRDGMLALFTVDAYPGETFHGKVRQIRNAPQIVQSVVTYDAVIDVENPQVKLRPGMTAGVTFIHDEREDVLRVPNAGIRFRPPPELASPREAGRRNAASDGPPAVDAAPAAKPAAPGGSSGAASPEKPADRRTVWVLRAGEARPVAIRIGVTDGASTEVLEGGLQAGDAVITDAFGGPASKSQRMPSSSVRRLF